MKTPATQLKRTKAARSASKVTERENPSKRKVVLPVVKKGGKKPLNHSSDKKITITKSKQALLDKATKHDSLVKKTGKGNPKNIEISGEPLNIDFGFSRFKPEFCALLVEWMAEGRSFETFGVCLFRRYAGSFLPSVEVLHDWCKKHPEFDEAKRVGIALCKSWWEQHGVDNLYYNKMSPVQFNHNLWYMNMKNRFGWGDNLNAKIAADVNVTVVSSIPRPARTDENAEEE